MMQWETPQREHALERVAVTFMFSEPIPSKPWAALTEKSVAQMISDKFARTDGTADGPLAIGGPGRQLIQIAIGPGGVPFPMPAQGGTSLVRSENGVTLEEVTLQPTACTLSTAKYATWSEFKERTFSRIGDVLKAALELTTIQSVKLEYWDRFTYHKAGSVDYSSLFSKNSKYVPSFYLGIDSLWHSHIGFFEPKLPWRRLVNANIDVVDVVKPAGATAGGPPPLHRSVAIYTMIEDANRERLADVQGIDATMEEIHGQLKAMLVDMLSDTVAEQISLTQKVT